MRRGVWFAKGTSIKESGEIKRGHDPLKDMLGELMAIQDETAWSLHYTFAADPIAKAIPKEEAVRLCREACLCGREQAAELKKRFGEASLLKICRAEQIQVFWDLEDWAGGSVRFAEYIEPNQIRINQTCADRAERLLQGFTKEQKPREGQEMNGEEELGEGQEWGKEQELKKYRISEVLLAHEYYHFLEYRNPRLFTAAYRQKTGRAAFFGPARLLALREIGAGAFAAELLGYPYNSSVYDVLLLYCFSPEEACKLYGRMSAVRSSCAHSQG